MLDDGTTLFQAPDLYDLEYARYLGDLAFYKDVCRRASPPWVLELGCGTGRLTLPLAEAGHRLRGIDVEPAMLDRLRVRLSSVGEGLRTRVELLEGDVRRYRGPGAAFGAVLAPFNALQHLDRAGLAQTLELARYHLAIGGLLAFDLFAPPRPDAARSDLGFVGAEHHPTPDAGRALVSEQRQRFDADAGRLETCYRYRTVDLDGRELERRELLLCQRQWRAEELEAALVAAGFSLVERYGDLDLSPLRASAPRILMVAQREPR